LMADKAIIIIWQHAPYSLNTSHQQ
jgi:hypothetical protein